MQTEHNKAGKDKRAIAKVSFITGRMESSLDIRTKEHISRD